MKKFIITAFAVVGGAIIGAYADKKFNLGIKGRVDDIFGGLARKISKKAEKPETTTGNDSTPSKEGEVAS